MTRIRRSSICLYFGIALSGPAFAQTDASDSAYRALEATKAPNTTTVGRNKPPSRDASPTSIKPIERVTLRQAADDAITTRVCIGCGGDPATTGSLSMAPTPAEPLPVVQPEKRDMRLDELRTASEPKRQSDLDTVALASAHREQAKSADERTTGLWQSWVVSVCAGCGDQKPAKALKLEDWPNRAAPLTTGSVDHKPRVAKAHPAVVQQAGAQRHGSFEANLSPDNLNTIRRMPRQ